MFLQKLRIHNYKSLRNVCFTPEPFAALIGPNASGKSNFADAVHFLSEVYEHGLETAIARKGGYENIAFRKQRRTTAPLDFEVTIQLTGTDIFSDFFSRKPLSYAKEQIVQLTHSFSFKAQGTDIKAAFKVSDESLTVSLAPSNTKKDGYIKDYVRLSRIQSQCFELTVLEDNAFSKEFEKHWSFFNDFDETPYSEQSLLLRPFSPHKYLFPFIRAVSRFKVYQFSPSSCREPAAPTPNPELEHSGKNLPALIDWLQKNHPKAWEQVTAEMQDILQGLNQISLQYLHTKALGLFFEEEGFGRSWNVDEISDGTIQTLAILAASADPRTSLLLIEEPENSVHPWIVRMLVERLKKVSKTKNVIVTSQSPVLVDELSPREVWIVARQNGETQIRQLTDIDPLIEDHWKAGKYQLSDFLDSGLVPQVVPGGIF